MSKDTPVGVASDPAMAIQVLQVALRASLLREEKLKRQIAEQAEATKAKKSTGADARAEAAANVVVPEQKEATGVDESALYMTAEDRREANQDAMKYAHVLVIICAILAMFAQSWWYRIIFLLMMFWLATVDT